MDDPNDDFGELYADFEFQSNSSINGVSQIPQISISNEQEQLQSHCGGGEAAAGSGEGGLEACDGGESESDDDDGDDFDVFVNDEDIGAKRNDGGGETRRCFDENVEGELGGGGENQLQVDVEGAEKSGGGGRGEKANLGRNVGSKLQCKAPFIELKVSWEQSPFLGYSRSYGSVFAGNQRAMSSWKTGREDLGYGQPRISGFVPGLAGNGNSFCLPWYRTIVDVDIDTIEQKSWTYPEADITDYFNYSLDEESWKIYCQSLDQLRIQTLSQTRNQVNESFKLKNDAGSIKEMPSGEFVAAKSSQFKQIGEAIQVEDSNTERQPSTDAKRPCFRDSDVIEITVQDPEDPCSSGKEEVCNTRETQCNMSEKKCDPGNSEAEVEQPNGFRSSIMSSDSKRSGESAAVSSHVPKHSDVQGKDRNHELDIEFLDKGETTSDQNLRAIGTVNYSTKDVDNGSDTEETNPCVAGIDLSFDDHGPSSRSPSYFNTCSETSQDYCGYSKRNQHLRRSSDFRKEKPLVANIGHQRSRSRDDENKNDIYYKNSSRVMNSIEENFKRTRRSRDVWKDGKRVELKYNYGLDCYWDHHHLRSEEWCRSTSDDEYWSGYGENESLQDYYDKRSVENQFEVECTKDFDRRDKWGSREEVDVYYQREWDEVKVSSDRRMRRMRGVIAQKDLRVEERECIIRAEKPYFRNRSFKKFSSFHDINCSDQGREFDDVDFYRRHRHHKPLQYRYDDDLVYDRFERSNPFDDRLTDNVDLDIKCEKFSWQSGGELGTYGRKEFFESSMDVDCLRYTVDYDDEYWNTQKSTYTRDLRDRIPYDDERRHQNSFGRVDTNEFEFRQRYDRRTNSFSGRKGRDNWHVYDHKVACNRLDAPRYLDEDEYSGKRRNAVQCTGMSWTEVTLFDECSDYDFHDGKMLDSSEGVKSHGIENGFVRGEMTVHKQITRGRFGVAERDKSYSKMSKRAKLEENGTWGGNSMELHHTVRERKSTGIFPKAGFLPNNDADGRFREQSKRRQNQDGDFPYKSTGKKTWNVEASRENISAGNHTITSELEDGQIPMVEPSDELLKGNRHFVHKDTLKGGHVYDENRILETMAKMEKRRERFKEPVLVKKDTDSNPKPEEGKLVETDSKGQRPTRKRKWVKA